MPIKTLFCLFAGLCLMIALPAFAADTATVVVAYGDWASSIAHWSETIIAALIVVLGRRLLPAGVDALVTQPAVERALDYVLAITDGAVRGKTLTLPVANSVLRDAAEWLVDNEPLAAKWAGDRLGALLAARLSAIGSAPEARVSPPATPAPTAAE